MSHISNPANHTSDERFDTSAEGNEETNSDPDPLKVLVTKLLDSEVSAANVPPSSSSSTGQFLSTPTVPIFATSVSSSQYVPPTDDSVPLWRSKDPAHEFEVDPINVHQVLVSFVNRLDFVSARCDELDSHSSIMQNSLFSVLNKKIDEKFETMKIAQKPQVISEAHPEIAKLNAKVEQLDNQLKAANQENVQLRKAWDSYMEQIRVHMTRDASDVSPPNSARSFGDSSPGVLLNPQDVAISKLETELESFKRECHKLDVRLVQLEQYSRRESLVLSGIPKNVPDKDLEKLVLEILENMGFTALTHDDVVAVHRLKSPPHSKYPPLVIAKFMNRKIVEWCMAHTETLQKVWENMGLDIMISESLCAKNQESLRICQYLKDNGSIVSYYTRNGIPRVVMEAGEAPVNISHPDHLRWKFENVPNFGRV